MHRLKPGGQIKKLWHRLAGDAVLRMPPGQSFMLDMNDVVSVLQAGFSVAKNYILTPGRE